MSRSYKIRETPPGRWNLTVPRDLMERFEPGQEFVVHATEDEIVFRRAELGPFENGRVDRIEKAVGTMAWWLVQAQTGFGERDACGIENILAGTSPTPIEAAQADEGKRLAEELQATQDVIEAARRHEVATAAYARSAAHGGPTKSVITESCAASQSLQYALARYDALRKVEWRPER